MGTSIFTTIFKNLLASTAVYGVRPKAYHIANGDPVNESDRSMKECRKRTKGQRVVFLRGFKFKETA
ncbi:MAG: hypothetical protein ABJQ42_07090 [Erythrobacter sp.]